MHIYQEIVCTDRFPYGLSTRPDESNTLTFKSTTTNYSPMYPAPWPHHRLGFVHRLQWIYYIFFLLCLPHRKKYQVSTFPKVSFFTYRWVWASMNITKVPLLFFIREEIPHLFVKYVDLPENQIMQGNWTFTFVDYRSLQQCSVASFCATMYQGLYTEFTKMVN